MIDIESFERSIKAREERAIAMARRRAVVRALLNFAAMTVACFVIFFVYFVAAVV